jgi:hypothetical protein
VKMPPQDVPADFKCSKCNAHYKVVRVKAETQSPKWLVHCKVKSRSPLWMATISSNTFSQRDRVQFAVETRANCPLFAFLLRQSAPHHRFQEPATCDQVRGVR